MAPEEIDADDHVQEYSRENTREKPSQRPKLSRREVLLIEDERQKGSVRESPDT